ncbi:hypothetical protein C497_19419 [Halalkalicoccus jeotgali B3]|uniref:Uncharacterized protein n=1 Tax=Halalkalicoccus jeotgali (strain DSM 18796 / CECT 7217 / JCM 14584 / KCTC 4019 / B3) TaxID=795797 RepID=D8JBI1_HALJB|nr:hypothetical protein HacjB3_16401 [Halalkalicoccus jeotgali B3]ELY32430.1 hypothetical protein C497_19419 [Halalkalicoccus jeotgali B3]
MRQCSSFVDNPVGVRPNSVTASVKHTPAGLVLDSQTIAKVITAAEGLKPHTQTVARVMNFLEKLGKDDVEQTKRRGKKLVVVDEEAADR